jgi:uracil-DNA glycosylase
MKNCAGFLIREIRLFRPDLILPVGRAAIDSILGETKLADVVGKKFRRPVFGHLCVVIPLPHPSGASPWVYRNPRLHEKALALLRTELGVRS